MAEVWWRNTWMEAVYGSGLKPLEKLVAAVYADHARDQRLVWVTLARLEERSGLARSTASRALQGLVDSGWLVVVEKARQHRATLYALVVPGHPEGSEGPHLDDSRSSGALPLSSSGALPQGRSGVAERTPGVAERSASSSGALPNQSSDPTSHSSSSSPAHKHLARLLGWAEDDERLDLLDDFLREHDVGKAIGWLNGWDRHDLERKYLDFVEKQTADPWKKAGTPSEEELWARKGPDVFTLFEQVRSNFVNDEAADERIAHEGNAIHQERRPIEELRYDRQVLISVLASIENSRKWGVSSISGLRPVDAKEAS